MNKLKSQKGVTLTSLIVYIIAMVIVVGIISVITKYFYANMSEINNDIDVSKEYTKLNSYLSEDINNSNNTIYACTENSIVFYNSSNQDSKDENYAYHQYTYQKDTNAIYYDKIKICNGIKECKFEEIDKESFKLTIKFEGDEVRETTYAIRKE